MADEKDIVICRCEDVTLGEIRELIKKGYATVDEIKRITRAGMGPCQGRTCRDLIIREIVRLTGKRIDEVPMPTFRPPIKPIKLGVLAQGEDEGE
ncbi:MAG: (2Fe-2S)-binding protein [Synergistetes bacterium]|nr:(2Fe-2S)-binding protein [Synergistota bacterium]MCX8128283.1 (2Fe-2S)-binding protein [Synergistota bacterium]MDW8192596.1 (2Fe-2S)-binding protein [Synergistota bacterium]